MRHHVPVMILSGAFLSACFFGPPEQAEILVNTSPPGAVCLLTGQGLPLVTISPTPAIALVEPAAGGLAVSCRRVGFADANIALPPYPASVLERRVDIALVPNPPWGPPR